MLAGIEPCDITDGYDGICRQRNVTGKPGFTPCLVSGLVGQIKGLYRWVGIRHDWGGNTTKRKFFYHGFFIKSGASYLFDNVYYSHSAIENSAVRTSSPGAKQQISTR
jgi:hypothetical protein